MMNVLFILVLCIVNVASDRSLPTLVSRSRRPAVRAWAAGKSLTIYNNCGDDTAVFSGARSHQVSEACTDGRYCTEYAHTNPAFWVATKGHQDQNFGARTLVEFNFIDPHSIWWDISLVKGFNYGVQVVAKTRDGKPGGPHPETTCTNVNCKDAYWICDTAWNNLFSPVYNTYGTDIMFDITFCPMNVTDTLPLQKVTSKRHVSGDPPFYCACSVGVTPQRNLVPPAGTVLNGQDCGSIL
jgi:hypothetical protein